MRQDARDSASRPPQVARLDETVYAVWCEDAAGSAAVRQAHLDGHLRHIEANFERYLVAGPMRRDGAERLTGSFLLVVAASEAEARALMEEDPYVRHGAYVRVEIRAVTPAAGRWLGGVIWSSADDLRSRAAG